MDFHPRQTPAPVLTNTHFLDRNTTTFVNSSSREAVASPVHVHNYFDNENISWGAASKSNPCWYGRVRLECYIWNHQTELYLLKCQKNIIYSLSISFHIILAKIIWFLNLDSHTLGSSSSSDIGCCFFVSCTFLFSLGNFQASDGGVLPQASQIPGDTVILFWKKTNQPWPL